MNEPGERNSSALAYDNINNCLYLSGGADP